MFVRFSPTSFLKGVETFHVDSNTKLGKKEAGIDQNSEIVETFIYTHAQDDISNESYI